MRLSPVWFACLLILGCEGTIGEPASTITPPDDRPVTQRPDGSFVCDPAARPSVTDLHRLSALQYDNTVRDLLDGAGLDAETIAGRALDNMPPDGTSGQRFDRMDTRLSPRHAESYFAVADAAARHVEADAEARRAVFGDCGVEADLSAACIDAFLDDFAEKAFRRPLVTEERTRFHAVDDGVRSGPEVARGLVLTALLSPQFLYQVEVDGETIEGDVYFSLGAYALASRLSYHFWGSMPDDELLAAAADGSILTDAGYRTQVERIFAHPRTRAMTEAFYRQWLAFGQIGGFPDTAVFNAFANGEEIFADGADHLEAMRAEIAALTDYYTWEADGDMDAMLLSDRSFTRSPYLARLYGVPAWDGVSDHPRFPEGERSGLLTRAAFLVTGEHHTNPVFRGAIVRRQILCQELYPPDAADLPEGSLDPPEFRTDMTTRQRYEEKTREQPCAGCHTQINPIGFVLERYDALGRYRTTEQVLDVLTGDVLAELPIDTSVVPHVTPDDTATIAEPHELMQRVADSGLVEACFARNYFRYTFGREETAGDSCALEEVRSSLVRSTEAGAAPGTLREALRAIALDPSFRQRVVGPQGGA